MATVETTEIKARGLLFTTLATWLGTQLREEELARFHAGLNDDTMKIIYSAEKGAWYPLQHLVSALSYLVGANKCGGNPLCEFGRHLCETSLTTSFKGLIVFIDPLTFIKRIPLFWRRYFRGGGVIISTLSPDKASVNFDAAVRNDTVLALFSGWLEQALNMVGASDIDIEVSEKAWQVSWSWSKD